MISFTKGEDLTMLAVMRFANNYLDVKSTLKSKARRRPIWFQEVEDQSLREKKDAVGVERTIQVESNFLKQVQDY